MDRWVGGDLQTLDAAGELTITAPRTDGSWPRPVPIWVVVAGGEVYVRTWHRRDAGWFGRAVVAGRARIGADGLESDVVVEDIGSEQRETVDAAYLAKYGRAGGGDRMVGNDAAATTLRLVPASDRRPPDL